MMAIPLSTVNQQNITITQLEVSTEGLAATLLDSCNSISAQCNLDKGFIALTTDIKVNYLSQISVDTGEIVATGRIDKLGRKVIFVTGELRDMNGKLLATASSTELVVQIF